MDLNEIGIRLVFGLIVGATGVWFFVVYVAIRTWKHIKLDDVGEAFTTVFAPFLVIGSTFGLFAIFFDWATTGYFSLSNGLTIFLLALLFGLTGSAFAASFVMATTGSAENG